MDCLLDFSPADPFLKRAVQCKLAESLRCGPPSDAKFPTKELFVVFAVAIEQRFDAIPKVDLEINRASHDRDVDQMRALPKMRLQNLIVQHDIMVGALFGEKCFDRIRFRHAVESVEEPKVLLHE